MKILVFISDKTVPTITGTRVRNHFLWPALKNLGVEVRLMALNLSPSEDTPLGPKQIPIEFFENDKQSKLTKGLRALRYSFQQWNRPNSMLKRVKEVIDEWQPDIIHAEELRMAYFLPMFHHISTKAHQTVTCHNVETDLLKMTGSSPFKCCKSLIEWNHLRSLKKFEKETVRMADRIFAYSELDKQKYQEMYPFGHWSQTQNGTNASGITPAAQIANHNILLVGSLSYLPNIKGIHWFIDEVLPLLPEPFRITVAGSNANAKMREKLSHPRVQFIDTPNDLTTLYADASLCAVPVFDGSGTRGKILEALSHERLVITTTLGVEGLPFNEQNGVIVANDSTSFSKMITEWHHQQERREELSKKGRTFILNNYDWQIVANDLHKEWIKLCE